MDRLKQYFLIPFWVATVIGLFYCIYSIVTIGLLTPWLGTFVALFPSFLFIMLHISKTIARTSKNLWSLIIFPILGALLCLLIQGNFQIALSLTIFNLVGNLLYIFWYSRNNRPPNPLLEVGKILPDFSLKTIDGQLVTSTYIKAYPSLILFFRGNWCPLCIKQIAEISAISNALQEDGINIYIVGAQSLEETQKIARKYEGGHMQFLYDPHFRALETLDLIHINGKPQGIYGFDRDTAYPTVLFINNGGQIMWSDQSDNYRLRPKPEIFMGLKSIMDDNMLRFQIAQP